MKVTQKERQAKLLWLIKEYKPKRQVEIHYMYYDQDKLGYPLIMKETDYNKELKNVLLTKIND